MKSAIVTASVATVQKAVRSAVGENVRRDNFIINGGEEEEPTEWDESGFENCIFSRPMPFCAEGPKSH